MHPICDLRKAASLPLPSLGFHNVCRNNPSLQVFSLQAGFGDVEIMLLFIVALSSRSKACQPGAAYLVGWVVSLLNSVGSSEV